MTGDAYHITAPSPEGEGAVRAMKMALKRAGIEPSEIGYINAHGTSTEYNDRTETLAIKKTFGDYAYKVPVSSTKSMVGHMLGAAAQSRRLFASRPCRTGMAPPTINYETPDPECDLDYVPNVARKIDAKNTA